MQLQDLAVVAGVSTSLSGMTPVISTSAPAPSETRPRDLAGHPQAGWMQLQVLALVAGVFASLSGVTPVIST